MGVVGGATRRLSMPRLRLSTNSCTATVASERRCVNGFAFGCSACCSARRSKQQGLCSVMLLSTPVQRVHPLRSTRLLGASADLCIMHAIRTAAQAHSHCHLQRSCLVPSTPAAAR